MEPSAYWSLTITRKPRGSIPIHLIRALLRILNEPSLTQFENYKDGESVPAGAICEWGSTGYGAYDYAFNSLEEFACKHLDFYFDLDYRNAFRGNSTRILAHGGDVEEIDSPAQGACLAKGAH